ncbi:MAG: ABC transporter ATP-binding protein [Planctomycetes bacterium]|nr:ABC transporter ATP-binding protein [Planctomycetota bacterium]
MVSSSTPLLSLQQVSRSFGDLTAVDSLDLQVYPGEIFALLGPNGAGKTTSMRMLIGTLQADHGTAQILEKDCFTERHLCMANTGYVPDEPSYPPFIRASELIRFQGEMHSLSAKKSHKRAMPLIERLQLEDAIDDFAINYSKGMKKKLAVVLALIHQPQLLIFDELTNGLDPYATRELHDVMREQAAAGAGILFSTHLLDQAERLCDRVAIIHKGKVAVQGTLEELRHDNEDDLEELFFRHTGDHALASENVDEQPAAGE